MSPPRNRKQRRAAAATESSPSESDIPLAHPPRNDAPATGKAPKTLVDIIAERQNELLQRQTGSPVPKSEISPSMKSTGTRFVTVDAAEHRGTEGGIQKEEDAESDVDKPLPPLLDTILLSLPLTTLHLTLAYLAAHQYAESTNVPRLVKDAVMGTFPLLTFLVHLFHGHMFSIRLPVRWGFLNPQPVSIIPFTRDKLSLSFLGRLIFPPTLRTIVYLPAAIMLGVHLITITNEDPYYAVMKKAPAYGTVWIWCILEMSFGAAVLGSLGPLIWGVWWMGYGII
ncbi:hypothetical protein N7528_009333 [Penicillium herquei]|nr:hypothetical protein N7528_009333 [Penicillium herquei]